MSVMDRFWTIPFTTRTITVWCVIVYIIELIIWFDISLFCLRPASTIIGFQFWRILTSPFFHGGLIHVLLNMLAFLQLGSPLEKDLFGSFQFMCLNFLLVITTGIIHCGIDFLLGWIGFGGWNNCAIGYSGIIFSLLTIHCHLAPHPWSFFGAKVPAMFYPWLSLLVLQLFMPNVSLTGHLSGILSAYCYIYNITSWILPSPSLLQKIESSSSFFIEFLVNRPGYILNPFLGLPSAPSATAPPPVASNAIRAMSSWLKKEEQEPSENNSNSNSIPNTQNRSPPVGVSSTFQSFSGEGYKLSDPTPNNINDSNMPIIQPVSIKLPPSTNQQEKQ